jgi:outer membrane protein TolC
MTSASDRRRPRRLAIIALTGLIASSAVHAQTADGVRLRGQRLAAADGMAPQGDARERNAGTAAPLSGSVTLREALTRGLEFNLAAIARANGLVQARGDRQIARSALLPNVAATLTDSVQRVNLAALGMRFDVPLPGFALPDVVGPFNVLDARARASLTVLDRTAWHTYRGAQESVAAAEQSVEDAANAIVLAIGSAYLQAVAVRAQVELVRAQVETAKTLFQRTTLQRTAGLATPIDLNRAQLQTLNQEQRLVALQADVARRKIDLARLMGAAPTDQYELADALSFSPPPAVRLDDALRAAVEQRADLKVAEAHVRAAQRALDAAQARRLPTVSLSGDYGASYVNPTGVQSTYTIVGNVRVPIWEGRRTAGEVERARGVLAQRQAERDDLAAQIEADVRKAFVEIEAAAGRVQVAERSIQVSRDNFTLIRQRFESGVSDNIDVVQAQEAVAYGEADYLNSLLAHNIAKLVLARAMGNPAENLTQFVRPR